MLSIKTLVEERLSTSVQQIGSHTFQSSLRGNQFSSKRTIKSVRETMPSVSLDHIIMLIGLGLVAVFSLFFVHEYVHTQFESAFWALEAVFIAALLCMVVTHRISALSITFYIVFWVFTLSRPTIEILIKGWHPFLSTRQAQFQLMLLFISVVAFFVATVLSACLLNPKTVKQKRIETNRIKEKLSNKQLQTVALVFFLICYVFMAYLAAEKMIFMQGRTYVEFFKEYTETAPLPIRTLATFGPYALCMYLATFPRKKMVYGVLFLYIAVNVPTLLFGLRGQFAFSLVFCLIYFLLRDRMGDDEKWIGTVEKTLLIVGIPVLMLLFDAMNYARAGVFSAQNSTFMKIVDFVHKQGVTFDILGYAFWGFPTMEHYAVGHNYTFGPFIDYICEGQFSHILFGTVLVPDTNSVETATMSNSFAHLMSYVTHPNYLGGEGYGSSYMLELYFDYSWAGVAVFNVIIGFILVQLPQLMKRSTAIFFVSLVALTNFYWITRDSAFGWIKFVVTPQFWISVIVMFVGVVALRYLADRSRFLSKRI